MDPLPKLFVFGTILTIAGWQMFSHGDILRGINSLYGFTGIIALVFGVTIMGGVLIRVTFDPLSASEPDEYGRLSTLKRW